MKAFHQLSGVLASIACLGLVVPHSVLAAGLRKSTPVVTTAQSNDVPVTQILDVSLQQGGTLHGQVVSSTGAPLAMKKVVVKQNQEVVATAKTDEFGKFQVSGLVGGVYQVAVGQTVKTYRVWASQTAPPAAAGGILLVSSKAAALGQQPIGTLLTNPWILGGVIAAAIAIPVAISNNKTPSS